MIRRYDDMVEEDSDSEVEVLQNQRPTHFRSLARQEYPDTRMAAQSSHGLQDESQALMNNMTINMDNCTRIAFGPSFVTEVHHTEEVFQAKFMCMNFKSKVSMKRFRCSLAVFLCWTLVVAATIASYIIVVIMPQHQPRRDIGLKADWYVRRDEWLPMYVSDREFLQLPVQYVLIGHSESYGYCDTKRKCKTRVREIQQSQIWRGYKDIAANYLVGGQGVVLEGTGANIQSEMTYGWEDKSINIMFVGNYVSNGTDQKQLDNVKMLLKVLVENEVLHPDYELYGSCQVDTRTVSPGPKIMKVIHFFDHWIDTNESKCLPGLLI